MTAKNWVLAKVYILYNILQKGRCKSAHEEQTSKIKKGKVFLESHVETAIPFVNVSAICNLADCV